MGNGSSAGFDLLAGVRSAAEWAERRRRLRRRITRILGAFPRRKCPLEPRIHGEARLRPYRRLKVSYCVQSGERALAWLFLPPGPEAPRPAVLCLHQTVPQGKDEPAGITGKRSLALAAHYARLGYVTLAPDSITAGERVYPGSEPYETAPFYERNPRWSAMGKMVWDHMRALDYLCSLDAVDPRRIGCIGHSLGGYNALFLAAYDERVAACIASCAFTPFRADDNPMRWARETWFCHMPRLRPYIERRRFPFDFEHVFALIAPRPLLVLTGLRDSIFGNTERCADSMAAAAKVYSLLGARNRIAHFVHPHGHHITRPGLARADAFFSRWLQHNRIGPV